MKTFGIDISKHQGNIDISKLKGQVDFIIIRAGYSNTVDPKFERNYNLCKELGIPVGAYWYSYALSVNSANKEADSFLNALKGKQFEYPVYLDMEDADGYKKKHGYNFNLSKEISEAFCKKVESAGYYTGIYASKSWFDTYLKGLDRFTKWVAHWADVSYEGKADMHQFTSKKKLNGYSGNLDADYCYKDFPKIIKEAKLNGFSSNNTNTNTKPKTPATTPKTPVKQSFFPSKGYFGLGDKSPNVGKVAEFMRKNFPAYTSKAALGNYYGPAIRGAIKEFQKRTGLKPDGFLGPLTLAKLVSYGFKY